PWRLRTVTDAPSPETGAPAPTTPRPAFHCEPVYPVGDEKLSILDLLHRFTDKKWERNGISRLADLHMKVGEAARFRLDGDLVPLDKAAPLTREMVRGLVHPLLRED